jgi:hypothetical protein
MMKKSFKLSSLLFIGLLTACGTTTLITSSWRKDHASANGYHNIFIAAMNNNIPVKQSVENGIQQRLQGKGLTVEKSIDVFPPDFSNQTGAKRQLILNKIQSTGADGILTVALLRKETESRYVPGGGYWNPGLRYGYYGRFWSYYNNWSSQVYAPGYYDEKKLITWKLIFMMHVPNS